MVCRHKRTFIGYLVLLVVFANGDFANASADEPSNWAKQDVRWMIARNIVPEHLQGDYQKDHGRERSGMESILSKK